MSDKSASVVHIGENSPEQVAFKLMEYIADVEKRPLNGALKNPADRKYILDTYAECLVTVRGKRRPAVDHG